MANRYASFLLRWWHLDGEVQRIEVEQIATGDRTVAPTMSRAVEWMDARIARSPGARPSAQGARAEGGERERPERERARLPDAR